MRQDHHKGEIHHHYMRQDYHTDRYMITLLSVLILSLLLAPRATNGRR